MTRRVFGNRRGSAATARARPDGTDNIEVGMSFEHVGEDGEEEMIYRITDIADGKVVVDGNHSLAGTALIFDLTVKSVRPASAEEIGHGHVHGEGGLHH